MEDRNGEGEEGLALGREWAPYGGSQAAWDLGLLLLHTGPSESPGAQSDQVPCVDPWDLLSCESHAGAGALPTEKYWDGKGSNGLPEPGWGTMGSAHRAPWRAASSVQPPEEEGRGSPLELALAI